MSHIADALPKILIVDDVKSAVLAFQHYFRQKYEVIGAHSAQEALDQLAANDDIQVVVSDQIMPTRTGLDFFREIRETHPRIVRILTTAHTDYNVLASAINSVHVFGFLEKPWNISIADDIIARALSFYRANQTAPSITVGQPEYLNKKEVDLSLDDIAYLQTVLQILRDHVDLSDFSKIRFSQIGEEIVISMECIEKGRLETIMLSQVKNFLDDEHIDSDSIIIRKLRNALLGRVRSSGISRLPVNDLPLPTNVAPPQVTHAMGSVSVGQFQVYLDSFINQSSGINARIVGNKTGIKAHKSAKALQSKCRSFQSESPTKLDELAKSITFFLDALNDDRSPERRLVEKYDIDTQTINGLFVHYNSIATISNSPILHPSHNLTQRKERFPLSYIIVASIIASFPIILLIIFSTFNQESDPRFTEVAQFIFITITSAIISLIAVFFSGKSEFLSRFDSDITRQHPFLIRATGGFSVFIILVILGMHFLRTK